MPRHGDILPLPLGDKSVFHIGMESVLHRSQSHIDIDIDDDDDEGKAERLFIDGNCHGVYQFLLRVNGYQGVKAGELSTAEGSMFVLSGGRVLVPPKLNWGMVVGI